MDTLVWEQGRGRNAGYPAPSAQIVHALLTHRAPASGNNA